MMNKRDPKIYRFLSFRKLNKNLLALLGWSDRYSSTLYRILPHIQLFLSLSTTIIILRFVRINYHNIAVFAKSLTTLTSYIAVSLKMTCLLIYREEFFELQKMLDQHFSHLLKKDHLSHFILNKIGLYQFLSWSFFVSVFITASSLVILPSIENINNYIHKNEPDHYIFPYPSSFPWPVPFSGLTYQIHFFYELIASFPLFLITVGVDLSFIFFVFLMIGQLRAISYTITDINEKSDCDLIVKRCITQYSLLMQCRDKIQKVYGPIILNIIATNALSLCTLAYQITQMKSLTILRGILFAAYITTKVIQTFMYSWCGTHLTMESENYRKAIYSSNWYGNKRFMIATIIMLQQRPLILKACSFTAVSIDIFVKILNTTVSYYFLLKTLES